MANEDIDQDEENLIAILYIDSGTRSLEYLGLPKFGETWTKPNCKYKIKNKKVQKAYAEKMSQLPDKGANGLVLYETLKHEFNMPPEKKVIWSLEDLIKFADLIQNNNAHTLVRAIHENFPDFYKFITLYFDEGEGILHKSSGWTQEQILQLQKLYVDYISMLKTSMDEKLHFESFFALKEKALSAINPNSFF